MDTLAMLFAVQRSAERARFDAVRASGEQRSNVSDTGDVVAWDVPAAAYCLEDA